MISAILIVIIGPSLTNVYLGVLLNSTDVDKRVDTNHGPYFRSHYINLDIVDYNGFVNVRIMRSLSSTLVPFSFIWASWPDELLSYEAITKLYVNQYVRVFTVMGVRVFMSNSRAQ